MCRPWFLVVPFLASLQTRKLPKKTVSGEDPWPRMKRSPHQPRGWRPLSLLPPANHSLNR
jgi:hypothetical protein